jgi:hypothetical protein
MLPVTLEIYVEDRCLSCDQAEALAAEAREWFPALRAVIHRLGPGIALPEGVVAVPAYVLEKQLVQYGTPERRQIGQAIVDAFIARLPQSQV